MKRNIQNAKKIWPDTNMKPEDFVFVKSYLSLLGLRPHNNWTETFNPLANDVRAVKDDFDCALLSCGSYGLPLANYIFSELDKSTWYVGAILQLCFGIKGKRWEDRANVKPYINEHWSRPSSDETPQDFQFIEGGCYW